MFVNKGQLVPGVDSIGSRPGSYIVFVREWGMTYESGKVGWAGINWQRWFYCENWEGPGKRYKVVYNEPSADDDWNGACYIDYAGGAPLPPPPTPPPPPPPTPKPTPTPTPHPTPTPSPSTVPQHAI